MRAVRFSRGSRARRRLADPEPRDDRRERRERQSGGRLAAGALALDARVVVTGPDGSREIPYDEFHVSYRKTALRQGELIVRIMIPEPPSGTIQRFRKVGTREAQAINKVVVAMAARVERGTIAALRLGAGSVAATPIRLRKAEEAGIGQPANDETVARVAGAAASEVRPIDDVRSTAAYRAFALERVVRRMVTFE